MIVEDLHGLLADCLLLGLTAEGHVPVTYETFSAIVEELIRARREITDYVSDHHRATEDESAARAGMHRARAWAARWKEAAKEYRRIRSVATGNDEHDSCPACGMSLDSIDEARGLRARVEATARIRVQARELRAAVREWRAADRAYSAARARGTGSRMAQSFALVDALCTLRAVADKLEVAGKQVDP